MKKTLLIVLMIVTMCLLSSCVIPSGSPAVTTPEAPGSTTAPPTAALPSLAALDAVLDAASPARIRLSYTSEHEAMGELRTDCYMLLGAQESSYYYYTTTRFLPLDEALAAGKATKTETGYLLTNGNAVTASSDEIDGDLLAELRDYSIRRPSLREELFAEYSITKSGDAILLTVIAKPNTAGVIFDELLDGADGLTFTVTFTDEGGTLRPTSLAVSMTADGTPASYLATYAYTPAPLPTSDTAPSPDLSLWE